MKKVGRIELEKQSVSSEMLLSHLENIKDLIKSSAKGTETALRKEIKEAADPLKADIHQLQVAVMENRRDVKEIKKDMQDMRTELKQEIHDSEERLGNKIDKNAIRLDDHATRITTLEEAR